MSTIRYPDPPAANDDALRRQWGELVRTLEIRDSKSYSPNKSPYVISNVSISRNFDPTTAGLPEVLTVLATLLQDLSQKGIIG